MEIKVARVTKEQMEEMTKEKGIEETLKELEKTAEPVKMCETEEADETEEDDDLLDILLGKIIKRNDLNVIVELRFYGDEEGLRIEAGGSAIAGEAFCALGPGYEALFEDIKVKFDEVAAWLNERMEELGNESVRLV